MKIIELINELSAIRDAHGDVEVLFDGCLEYFTVKYKDDSNEVYLW